MSFFFICDSINKNFVEQNLWAFGVVIQIFYYYGVDNVITLDVDEVIPPVMRNLGIL
jgi:hypothetical protein